MIDVLPGILETEFERVREKVTQVALVSKWIHIDFADGTLVPTQTPLDFAAYKALLSEFPDNHFEAHLIVATPEKYVQPLVDCGFRRLIAHVEAHDPRQFLAKAKYEEVEVGIALDGPSEVDQIEPFLEEVDFVLIACVEEGVSGQPFLPESIEKIKLIHENFPDLPIAAVGGINKESGKRVKEVGATRLISTSFLFSDPANLESNIEMLQEE